ncbi:HigA family addiction module antitoxin [Alcanivorax quisquiliarum]|uniref:HigA family addiction module antitoxin n=1 Tax=Alcanivorax quisquiliarum TaxID=2933565 RepID=A0ABT0E4X6_9GAMM|nr:HigA family addiction module antitoxin [Alcanivorax quisquiliarum]
MVRVGQRQLAAHLDVAASTLSRVLQSNSAISPEMALRLARVLGRSPESWLAMQDQCDLWVAASTLNLDHIHPLDFQTA